MILCWGDVGWDDYEDDDVPRPGGCALNVARSIALAGSEVGVAAPLGEDGRPLIDLLVGWGVNVRGIEVLGAPTPRQRIRLREGGERQLCGHRGGALVGYAPGVTARRLLAEAALVYVPVWQTTLPWLDLLWTLRDGPVALDLMGLEDLDPATVEDLIERAWIVFAGLSEGGAVVEVLLDAAGRTKSMVVITAGAQGGIAYCGDFVIPWDAAPLPGPPIDVTGCGDAFAGTFLAHLEGQFGQVLPSVEPLNHAVEAAGIRAAQVACHRGAVGLGLP